MPTVIDHVIQGTVSNGDKIDFTKEKLAVQAFIKGHEVAQAEVDASGKYKLTFQSGEERPITELRVVMPKAGANEGNLRSAEIVMPAEFVTLGNEAIVQRNLTLHAPTNFNIGGVLPISGSVYAQIRTGFELQPGLKMDFFAFQYVLERVEKEIGGLKVPTFNLTVNKLHCCTTFTSPQGTYAGSLTYRVFPIVSYFMVEISQFVNGVWSPVYSRNIGMDELPPDGHFDFLVPGDKIIPKPIVAAPATGFRFGTVGLIPCDAAHFEKGYVSTQASDPIPNLTHRPLRGTLRIFGLFAPTLQVAKYKFEIAETTADYISAQSASLDWKELAEPLTNHSWDPVKSFWRAEVMGPDPITHLYKNIDKEPEDNWMEHALKLEWNSVNYPDGFYVLRITALNQNNNPIVINNAPLMLETPIMRIDNSPPKVEIQAPQALECGKVVSANRTLMFNITAHDPQGHVLNWYIRALAGRDAIELNTDPTALQFSPPANTGTPGTGVNGTVETLSIVKLPPNLDACDPLVYNFELIAHGSAITGYPGSEIEVRDDVGLMVTKS